MHIFADIRVLWYEQNSKLCTLPKSLHFQIWINCAFTSYINKHSKKQKCEFSLKVNSSKNKWIQKYVKEENKKKMAIKRKIFHCLFAGNCALFLYAQRPSNICLPLTQTYFNFWISAGPGYTSHCMLSRILKFEKKSDSHYLHFDRSPAILTSDNFIRYKEIIRTKWPIYVVTGHFVLMI